MKAQHSSLPQLFAALLTISCASSNAVVTSISKQGTDVVLSWPSSPGQQFVVQFRETVDTNSAWTTLTNGLSAAADTNYTTFIHAAVLPESGQQMQAEGGAATQKVQLSAEELEALRAERKAEAEKAIAWLTAQLYEAAAKAQAWRDEVAKNPALLQAARQQAATASAATLDSSSGCCGFYRVLKVPNWAFNLTNYTYDGPTFFTVDFGDYLERIDNCEVLLNGEPSPFAEFMPYVDGGETNWGMGIYFDRMPSGTYQIQLRSTVRWSDDLSPETAYLVLSNRTSSIVVENQVIFTNWNEAIQGDTYTLRAQTANTDTDWQIDIYDAWDNYVNSGSGHTYNGQIAWTWNLRDTSGILRDDLDNDPFLVSYITFDTAGAGALAGGPTTRRQPLSAPGYPNSGEWLTAFQDRWFSDAPGYPGDCQEKFSDAMDYIAGGPWLIGDESWWYPIKFGTNVYSQAQREGSWTNLLAWLGDGYIRNFYYHGHGAGSELGCDKHNLGTNGFVLSGGFTSASSKSRLYSWQVALRVRAKRYRFVFLDGCSTAAGNWPSTFSISRQTNTISFYQNHSNHPRPSVFVGWIKDIGGPGYGNVYDWLDFEQNWMGLWANSFPDPAITEALEDANSIFHWLPSSKFQEDIRYYGYPQMTIRDYNSKGNWRWP
ncbi:MAG: hypothetical protein HZA90_02685 [Verrucomicrobia bacterium]|nr:hypothetical protein [Verrucomicrobiota bacterium]